MIPDLIRKYSLFLVIFCITIFSVGCLTLEFPEFLITDSDFYLEIESNVPLQNATFFLPLPVKNSIPMVGNRILTPVDFQIEGYSVVFTSMPYWLYGDVSYPVEFEDPANTPVYLQVSADSWPNGTYRIEIRNRSDYLNSPYMFMNTLHPLGNESVILPKWEFSIPEPRKNLEIYPFSDTYSYNSQNSRQSTVILSNYTSSPESLVVITISIRGTNQWLNSHDNSMANSYNDFFYGSVKGEGPEVDFIKGKFTVGDGNYPDLSSPKWQKFIKKHSSGLPLP